MDVAPNKRSYIRSAASCAPTLVNRLTRSFATPVSHIGCGAVTTKAVLMRLSARPLGAVNARSASNALKTILVLVLKDPAQATLDRRQMGMADSKEQLQVGLSYNTPSVIFMTGTST